MRLLTLMLTSTVVVCAFVGCASIPLQSDPGQLGFKSRARSRSDGGVRVSTSVLSAAESLAVYGVPLAKKGLQPVWIEVENRDAVSYWLMLPGVDPHFFPASGAADVFASGRQRDEIARRFRDLVFRNPVPAGTTVSGFVLTNLDEGVKMVSGGYTKLSRVDARNDSQVLFYDQVIPGSTLVGYLNADHWALSVPISRSHRWLGSTLLNHNGYPREALLRFVEWDLTTRGQRH